MDIFKLYFKHLSQYRVLLCIECGHCVLQAHFKTHLGTNHKHISLRTRKQLTEIAISLTGIAETVDDIVFPEPDSYPIEHLPLFSDGFKCRMLLGNGSLCEHITRGEQNIQSHCRHAHGWTNERPKGRLSRYVQESSLPPKPYIAGVYCQQFFKSHGKLQRLFQVHPHQSVLPVLGRRRRASTAEFDAASFLRQSCQDYDKREQRWKKKKRQEGVVEPASGKYDLQSWLRKTGWMDHLKGLKLSWLKDLTRPADPESEKPLYRASKAVMTVICKAYLLANHRKGFGSATLHLLAKREFGGKDENKVLYTGQDAKTIIRYAKHWMAVFRYIWRGIESDGAISDQEDQQEEDPGEMKRPMYELQDRQLSCLLEVKYWSETENVEHPHVNIDDDDLDGDDEDSDDDQEDEQAVELNSEVARASLGVAGNDDNVNINVNINDNVNINVNINGNDNDNDNENEKLQKYKPVTKLERSMLEFLDSLLDHDLGDDEYSNALISGLAVLGVDAKLGWTPPIHYTGILSAFVTVAKFLVLYLSWVEKEDEIESILQETIDVPRKQAERTAGSIFDRVSVRARRYLTVIGSNPNIKPSPVDWILGVRAYARSIVDNENKDGTVNWVGDTIFIDDIRLNMTELRDMIHGLRSSVKRRLFKDLLLVEFSSIEMRENDDWEEFDIVTDIPQIPWMEIIDDASNREVGYSFLTDERNTVQYSGQKHQLGDLGRTWLWNRMYLESWLRKKFLIISGRTSTLNTRMVAEYQANRRRFLEDLLILVKSSAGMPPRLTEATSISYQNHENGMLRGINIEDGVVVTVTRYSKTQSYSSKSDAIHRYLPREVGEILVYYLWLVVPFYDRMRSWIEDDFDMSYWIWKAKPEAKLEDLLLVEGIGEKKDVVARASEKTGLDWNEAIWNTSLGSKALARISSGATGQTIKILQYRHMSIAILRRYTEKKTVSEILDGRDKELAESASEQQAGHSTRTGQAVYGRLTTEGPHSRQAKREQFRAVSSEWHRIIGFDSPILEKNSHITNTAKAAIDEEHRRWREFRRIDIDKQLRHLMKDPKAGFRGSQRKILQSILKQDNYVVAIMGTGSGKSLLFMLPASISTGVTIVVVPLVSLRENMMQRCKAMNISCAQWSSDRPVEGASIVLVVPESINTESFSNFVNRLVESRRLDRFVIDECHMILETMGGWRLKMHDLQSLIRAEVQIVYLTATLPPREERDFIRLMGLQSKENTSWFRESTRRKNIKYQVKMIEPKIDMKAGKIKINEEEDRTVLELVESLRLKYPLPGQILVYCETVEQTKRLSKLLNCSAFHSRIGPNAMKRSILNKLVEGTEQVFVSTSALGMGIDRATIRATVHVGKVRGLRNYSQESGRAGRDGEFSEAIMIVPLINGQLPTDMEKDVKEYVMSKCRRVIMDRMMDGLDRMPCRDSVHDDIIGEDEQLCDICSGIKEKDGSILIDDDEMGEDEIDEEDIAEIQQLLEQNAVQRSLTARRHREFVKDHEAEKREFEAIIKWWAEEGKCQICAARRDKDHLDAKDYQNHTIGSCTRRNGKFALELMWQVISKIKFENFSCCFGCALPFWMCNRYEKDEKRNWRVIPGSRCQYGKRVVIGAVTGIVIGQSREYVEWIRLHHADAWDESCKDIEQDETKYKDFVRKSLTYLGKKTKRLGGEEGNEMCRLIFDWCIGIL